MSVKDLLLLFSTVIHATGISYALISYALISNKYLII
jgi:hypothetical protein